MKKICQIFIIYSSLSSFLILVSFVVVNFSSDVRRNLLLLLGLQMFLLLLMAVMNLLVGKKENKK